MSTTPKKQADIELHISTTSNIENDENYIDTKHKKRKYNRKNKNVETDNNLLEDDNKQDEKDERGDHAKDINENIDNLKNKHKENRGGKLLKKTESNMYDGDKAEDTINSEHTTMENNKNTITNNINSHEDTINTQEEISNESEVIFYYANKRKPIKWTPEEEKILSEGIRKYGKGRWAAILKEYKSDLDPNRRLKDLSDKLRVIEKDSTYRRRNKIEFWEVDKNNQPVVSNMGEIVKYWYKLPYEAAYRVAMTKNYSRGNYTIRICYFDNGKNWYHYYNASYDKNRKKRVLLRKIAGQSAYRNDGFLE